MSKLTKNRKLVLSKIEPNKVYKLGEAAALLKEITFTKFDASVDLDVRLGVDPRKSNQMVRGVVTLPHGTGKSVRVLVLCTPDKEKEATEAGADYVGLDEYVEKMPEDQKCIYFAAGDDTDRLGKLPNAQLVLSKGYDLLLCTEDVDEFCLQMMRDYKEKEFKNINSGDLGLETEDEKKAAEAAETENKDLFEEIKKDLNGKVKEVKVNPTLQEHPVTLSAEGGISMEMEKVLRRMPNAEGVESTKVLELNPLMI